MIRSLVAPDDVEGEEYVLRRNLTQEALEQALAEDCAMWIDIVDPDRDELSWLENTFKLHPAVISDLLRADRRPTLMIYPDYLFLSLFQAQIRGESVEGDEIHCLIGEKYFITVRSSGSTSAASAYDLAAQNPDYWRLHSIVYFLYLTIQYVVDSYYPLLDRISLRLNNLEESIMTKRNNVSQQAVYRVKKQLIGLRQMVSPQREVLSNIIGEARMTRTGETRDLFRHLYERLLRVYDVIDSQRDLASNVLDLLESQEQSRVADAVGRLTVLSMIFLPLTFLVGLFGLNFITTLPELAIPLSGGAMFILILFFALFSAAVMAWFFRKRGWL